MAYLGVGLLELTFRYLEAICQQHLSSRISEKRKTRRMYIYTFLKKILKQGEKN